MNGSCDWGRIIKKGQRGLPLVVMFFSEPEGCFFYDGSVMLAHTNAIWRIDK